MGLTAGSLRGGAFALLIGGCAVLAGCDDVRRSIAAAVHPASAQDVARSVHQKLEQGKFKEAHDEGAAFIAEKGDPLGVVGWETAKASAQAGLADDAIRYASLAVNAHAVTGVDLMAEPLLSPVHTDPRLVALAAGGGASPAAAPPAPAPAAGTAAAAIGSGGVKASAGDVSVELPD